MINLGLTTTTFGSQSDVYDSAEYNVNNSNGKTSLNQITLSSDNIKITIGSGGTGNKNIGMIGVVYQILQVVQVVTQVYVFQIV